VLARTQAWRYVASFTGAVGQATGNVLATRFHWRKAIKILYSLDRRNLTLDPASLRGGAAKRLPIIF
jgi:hypothetical protein